MKNPQNTTYYYKNLICCAGYKQTVSTKKIIVYILIQFFLIHFLHCFIIFLFVIMVKEIQCISYSLQYFMYIQIPDEPSDLYQKINEYFPNKTNEPNIALNFGNIDCIQYRING